MWLDKGLAESNGKRDRNQKFSDAAIQFCLSIKFLGEGEPKRKKRGEEYRCQWRKVHLGIDSQTLEIQTIKVTDNCVGDAPILPKLIAQIPADEPMISVSADGAYGTRACHEVITQRGAAVIKSAQHWKSPAAETQVRNEAVLACKRLGWRIWKTGSGYHWRSLMETKMRCFKKLDERVMARTFERQVVKLHVQGAPAQPLQPTEPSGNGCRGITALGCMTVCHPYCTIKLADYEFCF